MRSTTIVMFGLAVVVGAIAIFTGKLWLDKQSGQRLRAMEIQAPRPAPDKTIVVAAMPLKFGTEIGRQHLREIRWPEGEIPKGAFSRIDDVLDGATRRVALSPLDEYEPLLRTKVTGPGQRATLTALLEPGMKATSVRVNDINGVAGFVLPGERVDVLLTRNVDKGEAYTDVLLQNVKVLAIDQSADERADKPALVKAVTFEVNTADAQKLTLATTVGAVSLALRSAGQLMAENTGRVTIEDLSGPPKMPQPAIVSAAYTPPSRQTVTVGVTRGTKRQEYSVPVLAPPSDDIASATATTATTVSTLRP